MPSVLLKRSLCASQPICTCAQPLSKNVFRTNITLSSKYVSTQSSISPKISSHRVRVATRPLALRLKSVTSKVFTRPTTNDSAVSIPLEERKFPEYVPPKTGLLSLLPAKAVPYGELLRLDKPAGTYYLFFPCLFSTLLAAPLTMPLVSPWTVLGTAGLFFAGALIMRGAGCIINDLWDRNLDPLVERTRLRPIARKAISPQKAIVFTGFQLLAGLAVLLQFPGECFYYAVPSLALVTVYPLAKRITNYPQFVLGLTFSWGAIMGFPALGINLFSDTAALTSAALLYWSCVSWTLVYDMIYAHMDIRDDVKAGIKSIARAHEHNTKAVLTGISAVQISLLAAAGLTAGAGPVFLGVGCGGAVATLALMIWKVKIKDPKSCLWWFTNGSLLTGGVISTGLFLEYLSHLYM